DLLTLTFRDVTHPDDVETNLSVMTEEIEMRRRQYAIVKRYVRPDGTVVWADLSVSIVRGPDGKPRNFISRIEDITARVQSEKSLKTSEERLRHVYDAVIDPLWEWDVQTDRSV